MLMVPSDVAYMKVICVRKCAESSFWREHMNANHLQ